MSNDLTMPISSQAPILGEGSTTIGNEYTQASGSAGKPLKICSKCKEHKHKKEFSKNKETPDGLQYTCKPCVDAIRLEKGTISKEHSVKMQNDLAASGELFQCRKCKQYKNACGFYYQRDYGTVRLSLSKCKSCQVEYQRIKTFGVTDSDYYTMLANQNGACAICHISAEDYANFSEHVRSRFAVDHCHKTGKIRGLLCDKCNRAIGLFNERKEHFINAIAYLGL